MDDTRENDQPRIAWLGKHKDNPPKTGPWDSLRGGDQNVWAQEYAYLRIDCGRTPYEAANEACFVSPDCLGK